MAARIRHLSIMLSSILARLCLLGVLVALAACSTNIARQYADTQTTDELEARYFQVKIPTHDGLYLKATLYQPHLKPGETAPLIVNAPGYGGMRTSGTRSVYAMWLLPGKAVIEAWKQGFWVLSYDQRGWGDSQGKVEMMQQEYEVKDLSTVISWAMKHIPRITPDANGDIRLGMMGESFAGGLSILASQNDPRIDAVVPIATWHDLVEGIAPERHLRMGWGALLLPIGSIQSQFDDYKTRSRDYLKSINGRLSDEAAADMSDASIKHWCAEGKYPQANALLIQGFKDSLFSINHALANQACFEAGGKQADLVAIQGGHLLPWPMQKWHGFPQLFSTHESIECSGQRIYLKHLIVDFFRRELRDEAIQIPHNCFTFDDDTGVIADALPTAQQFREFDNLSLRLPTANLYHYFTTPWDKFKALFIPKRFPGEAHQQKIKGGVTRPLFIPVMVAREDTYLTGLPELEIRIDSNRKNPILFAAIGKRQPDSRYIETLSEQVYPLPGKQSFKLTLPAISAKVKKGETVGLMLMGYHDQFFLNTNHWFKKAWVSGKVGLPNFKGFETPAPAQVAETLP